MNRFFTKRYAILLFTAALLLAAVLLSACSSGNAPAQSGETSTAAGSPVDAATGKTTDAQQPGGKPSSPDDEPPVDTVTPHEHQYGDWVVLDEPNCAGVGREERICTVCGDVQTRNIPALGHSFGAPEFIWNVGSVSAARVCSACGSREVLQATVTAVTTAEPSCTESGEQDCTATVTVDGKDYTDKSVVVLSPLGHDFVNGVCTRCGETRAIPIRFSVENASGSAGENVTVNLLVSDNPDIAGYSVSVLYDETKLEVVSVRIRLGAFGTTNKQTPGKLRILATDMGTNPLKGNGVCAEIVFKIKDGTQPCEIVLTPCLRDNADTVYRSGAATGDYPEYPAEFEAGTLTVVA